MAGAEGFEPPRWLDQNQLPYHLATPQYLVVIFIFYMIKIYCQYFILETYIEVFTNND